MARRTFFSFHYKPDVWRAWNVRNSRRFKDSDADEGFFDSSVVEETKKKGEDNLKDFLRDGMKNSSVTCVLAGTDTWSRKWVRYEIARSVIKGNGLFTVFIHGCENKDQKTCARGHDPLDYMGLYKSGESYYLAEKTGTSWAPYADYTRSIPANVVWFKEPTDNNVVILSKHCLSYDFVGQNGRQNLSAWIDTAADMAGR